MNVFILQSQQAAWTTRTLIQAEPGAGNRSTLVLNNSSGSSVSLTGLEVIGQQEGSSYTVLNRGADPIVLLSNNAESITANQFADGATLGPDGSAEIYYNGLKWEILSSGAGGGIGINFDEFGHSTDEIELWNENFVNFQGASRTFALGDLHPAFNGDTYRDINPLAWQPHYSVDVEPVVTLYNSAPFAGVFSYPIMRAVTGSNNVVHGLVGQVQSYGSKVGGFNGNLDMRGVYGASYVRSFNETAGYGGYFEVFTGGNIGLTNTTPLWGIYAKAAGGHNGITPQVRAGEFLLTTIGGGGTGTITDGRGVQITVDGSGAVTVFDIIRGLSISGWADTSSGTWNKSYGIYIDATIDRGDVEKWAIYSLSTSDSLFTGPVRGPVNPYGVGWNGSSKFATEDAVYDKIETIVLGSGLNGTGTVDQATYFTGLSTVAPMPLHYYGSSHWRFFHTDVATDQWVVDIAASPSVAGGGNVYIGNASSDENIFQLAPTFAQIQFENVVIGRLDGYGNGTALEIYDTNINFRADDFTFERRVITPAGTTGAQTINSAMGVVNLAAGQSTLVVTNNKANASSTIWLFPQKTDATAKTFTVDRAAGSFTIKTNAATAETPIAFWVIN